MIGGLQPTGNGASILVSSVNEFDVSVVIPTFNRAHLVARAVESVLAQTRPVREIIVVDDGSTDNTRDVIQRYVPKVRYLYQENAGVASARNLGIGRANGEWIAFVDSDDEWYPHKISVQCEILDRHPQLRWCACNFDMINASGCHVRRVSYRSRAQLWRHGFLPSALEAARRDTPLSSSGMLIHRSVFRKVGLFDTSLPRAEDNDLWWRIGVYYPSIGYCPDACERCSVNAPHSLSIGGNPCRWTFDSLAKNVKLVMGRSDKEAREFLHLARMISFRQVVRLHFAEDCAAKRMEMEHLRLFPPSAFAAIVLKMLDVLPAAIGGRMEGRIRDLHRQWNRWR